MRTAFAIVPTGDPITGAISIDFAVQAPLFSARLVDSRLRCGANAIAGGEITGRMMANDPATGTDRRWSALMSAAQAGDGTAYRTLLQGCIPVIKAIARRRGVETDRIDDVVQEVLLTVHRARHTFDPSRSFMAWLSVIVERRAIDLIRRVRRQGQREVYSPLAFERHADEEADPSREIALVDRRGAIELAVEALPGRQREAVQHLLIEERSLAEAAAITRRSKGSLKVNLHRALKALRGRTEGG